MELKIVKFFNQLGKGTVVDSLTKFVSEILFLAGSWTALTIWIFFFVRDGRSVAVAMTIAAGIHFLITEGFFKRILARYFFKKRPYVAHPDEIEMIGKEQPSSAFPSSHMSANVAVLVVVAYFFPDLWLLAIVFALLVGFSRLHNGMHYLSDVFFGAILGTAYGATAIYLVKNYLYVLS